MEKRSLTIITGQILLAITIFLSTYLVTHTLKQIKLRQGTIYVKGCAEKEIESDFVTWYGSFSAIENSPMQAYEKIEKDLDVLQLYLQNQGLSLDEVLFSPVYTSIIYKHNENGHQTNAIENYEMSQSFSIASSNIPLISKVAQNITTLIKEGLSVSSSSPQYFYLKIDELKIQMLGEAAKDARQRADELVTNSSGSSVGNLRSAQQGVFQITPVYSNSISDYGECDTSSIQKRIKAVVTMEYAID
jgi:uncharacterized protein